MNRPPKGKVIMKYSTEEVLAALEVALNHNERYVDQHGSELTKAIKCKLMPLQQRLIKQRYQMSDAANMAEQLVHFLKEKY